MKRLKFLSICLVCVLLGICLIGCESENMENETLEEIVYPPVRVSEFPLQLSLARSYTLEEAVTESDMIALVNIGNWIGENPKSFCTYFSAEVIDQLKGASVETVILQQDGCSNATINGYPLFTHGNKMLLFLKKTDGTDYENAYWIMGAFLTIFDYVEVSDQPYLLDRLGYLTQSVSNETEQHRLLSSNDINVAIAQQDDVWGVDGIAYPSSVQAYRYDDIKTLIDVYNAS